MRKGRCSQCGKVVQLERSYRLEKPEGKGAGNWSFCSDLCIYQWLELYNPLLKLVEKMELPR